MYNGKLYRDNEEQLITTVNYRLLCDNAVKVSGELIPDGYGQISDGGDYIVELEDSHRIKCNLIKNVNRPVMGLPPRFVYRFISS